MHNKLSYRRGTARRAMLVYMLGLDMAYLCTKFDDCSLSGSRDIVGAHPNLNSSRDLTTPLFRLLST